jgi:hypothetical protein
VEPREEEVDEEDEDLLKYGSSCKKVISGISTDYVKVFMRHLSILCACSVSQKKEHGI